MKTNSKKVEAVPAAEGEGAERPCPASPARSPVGAGALDGAALARFEVGLESVAEDLALDEALLLEADSGLGAALVRFWEPREFAVVLGASRRLRNEVRLEACRADGVSVFRRSSGGGTVVIGPGALNVTVVLPESAAPGLSAVDVAQRFVLDWIAEALRRAGLDAGVLGHGDLVLGDRKCGGSAQRRLKHWFLVHCSILYQFPIERIARYLALPERQPAYRRGRPHADFVANLGLDRPALVAALAPGGAVQNGAAAAEALRGPLARVNGLVLEKFGAAAWTERL